MSASQRSTISLSDTDIRGRLTPAETIAVVREAVVGVRRGTLTAPPRVDESGSGAGPFQSVGATAAWYGYVSSDGRSPTTSDSVVVLHNRDSHVVRAMAVGSELARLCEAGILGLAADLLSAPDASVLAVIGDARSVVDAIRAIAAVRPLTEVRIHSPFGMTDETDLAASFAVPVIPNSSLAQVVTDASIVLMLSGTAAGLDPTLIGAGCTVLVVGDPARAGEDFPLDLAASFDVLTTDSPAQLAADGPSSLAGLLDDIISLGSIADGVAARRGPADRVGCLSLGLPVAQLLMLDGWSAADPLISHSSEQHPLSGR